MAKDQVKLTIKIRSADQAYNGDPSEFERHKEISYFDDEADYDDVFLQGVDDLRNVIAALWGYEPSRLDQAIEKLKRNLK